MGRINRKSRGLLRRKRIGKHSKKAKVPVPATFKEHWDPTKSVKFNYDQLGIRSDADKPGQQAFRPELAEALTSDTYVPSVNKPKQWEVQILQRLVEKHGRKYTNMAKDQKVNVWLWTAKQIQRKVNLLNQA